MANYNFKENPTYQTQIRAWSNSDPANAETVLNPVVEAALNNTHAVKISVDQHKDDADKHITSSERSKLKEIAEGANKYTHPNSGVTAGTYRSVTVNAGGHVTSGSNPTTISGYGLTDAYTKTEIDTKINTKANTSALTDHTGNNTVHVTSTERTNWNDANGKKHEHSNKSVLDGISSAKVSNWDNASTNSHTHSNKTVLDGITSAKITNWDSASTNNHTHSNKTVLDSVTSAKLTNWDTAASNNHTHSNKSILDNISQTKVSTWDGYDQRISTLGKSFINTVLSNDFTLTSSDPQTLSLRVKVSNGNNLNYDSANKCIVVGTGVKFVKISAQVYFYTGTWGTTLRKGMDVKLNGTNCLTCVIPYTTQYLSSAASPCIIPVSQGDKITLTVSGVPGDLIKAYDHATFMIVETIN